jgi:AcrR family transcriptional regulator
VAVTDLTTELSPRRARRQANRQAIMAALETLLADRSYQEVRVEDVMAAAGLTRTAFYRYFPDLESVLLAWLEIVGEELKEAANLWLSAESDPEDGLLAATTALAEVWARHSAVLRGIFDAATTGSRIQRAWRELVAWYFRPVEERFEGLTRDGRTSLAHPAETARALVWMTERYLSESYTRDLGVPVEVAAATLADIWRRAVFSGAG